MVKKKNDDGNESMNIETMLPGNMMHDSIQSELPAKLLHPWEQSTKDAEYIIDFLTLPGDTVLDCFCGSGTTGVAAIKVGRNFIGLDIDQSVLEVAEARIKLVALPEQLITSNRVP